MQNLSLRYTKWINFSQGRTGHVFQGRYKALLLDADSYLLEIVRYVHLNPVRAGMVDAPEDYPWSGHRAYLGMEIIPWLSSVGFYRIFPTRSTRREINTGLLLPMACQKKEETNSIAVRVKGEFSETILLSTKRFAKQIRSGNGLFH